MAKTAARRAWRVERVRFDPYCDYCGVITREDVHETDPRRATVEDIVPLSKGGANNRSNWALACWTCNQAKGVDAALPTRIVIIKAKHNIRRARHEENIRLKRGRLSKQAPVSQKLIDRVIAEDRERKERCAALGFSLYAPIPGVVDDAFR